MNHSVKITNIIILIIVLTKCLASCQLKQTLAVVATNSVTDITQSTATSGGIITSDGHAEVTSKGICWNTSENPTIDNSKTSDGTGIGSFISYLNELTAGTKYFVRAYASNKEGTSYGSQVSFSSIPANLATLTTSEVTSITSTTAVSGGIIIDDGGGSISSRGVCWRTSSNPTIGNNKTIDGAGVGSFLSNVSGLQAGTTYYIKAYATNSAGTAYGSEISFMTINDIYIPSLLSPINNSTLDNACTNGSDSIKWSFDWSDCESATSYNLYVIFPSATIPVIDVTVTNSDYQFISIGYVPDENLIGWIWKVRAMINGEWGDWSNTGTFNVEPVNTDCPGK